MASGKTILLVEDDFDVREAMVDALGEAGYRVLAARDGREALERLDEGPRPDLILLDLMMPRMDGYQFRVEQRGDPRHADIPVILVSADRKVHERYREMGVAAYLAKPVRLQQLLGAIAGLI
jgi:CheY-like chemotaxis protein